MTVAALDSRPDALAAEAAAWVDFCRSHTSRRPSPTTVDRVMTVYSAVSSSPLRAQCSHLSAPAVSYWLWGTTFVVCSDCWRQVLRLSTPWCAGCRASLSATARRNVHVVGRRGSTIALARLCGSCLVTAR